jgi:3-hydroxyisobutyrate dehydrogenase-like beta-hydroxyacid dehydrogenase
MENEIGIGFVGLGNMGNLMAGCILQSGYDLTIHDIRRDAGRNLEDQGAIWAENPREVAVRSDVVLTSLPGPKEVESVVLGKNGLQGIQLPYRPIRARERSYSGLSEFPGPQL